LPFVGRSAEVEALIGLLPRGGEAHRRVVLLAGEAGSGKSRLVGEVARDLEAHGALVASGACDAVVATPYGPFVEALDRVISALEDDPDPAGALGPGAGELTRLLPDLPMRIAGLSAPVDAESDTVRHRLHTAVTGVLSRAGGKRPLLLVLEDAHWADSGTLLLLRHLARASWSGQVLIIVTLRDTEIEVSPALSDTLADLRRVDDVVRMRLTGLLGDDVDDFVRRAAGSERLDPEARALAETMHGLTDGNPFLMCELWRALLETGTVTVEGDRIDVRQPLGEIATPAGVREVVSQRLARLDPGAGQLLELAATAGSEFELDVIRRAVRMDDRELLAALEETVASGMVEELPGPRLAYRFTHELVRRAVYDRLSRARRAELHLRVGQALADGPVPDRALADLAHHFSVAAPLGARDLAVDYNVRAAQVAAAALAFDDAATRLQTAVDLGIDDEHERAQVLLELGDMENRAGNAAAAFEAFAAAAAIARRLGGGELLARAAIGHEDTEWRPGELDADTVELLEEAIPVLGDHAPPQLRVGLLAGLARALDRRGHAARGATVRGQAIALARQADDRSGLAKVLVRSYWSRGTSAPQEILAMLDEAEQIAEELNDSETRIEAVGWRVPTFVSMGDMASARAEIATMRRMAEGSAQPFIHHIAEHYGSAIALADGRLSEAEAMAERSREWGELLIGRDASGTFGIQMFSIRREQGRLRELAPAVRVLAGGGARAGPWRPGLAAVLVELGMHDEARRELTAIAADGLRSLRVSLWTAALVYMADAATALGDAATAALVYDQLKPLAGQNVMIGHLVACYGSADRYLGMLAATIGDAALADAHFERALDLNRRMGVSTWVAHTAYQYARHLRGRVGTDPTGHGERDPRALAAEAGRLAARIGLPALAAQVASLELDAPAALPNGLSAREVQILRLVAQGLSNKEIGGTLAISEHTAANHIRSILRKTDCANRTEATTFAHRHGLVSTSI
jgi:DNA-binding CsgD family transcriptional regulator/tetratricopeptide (TPR) repeat protein